MAPSSSQLAHGLIRHGCLLPTPCRRRSRHQYQAAEAAPTLCQADAVASRRKSQANVAASSRESQADVAASNLGQQGRGSRVC